VFFNKTKKEVSCLKVLCWAGGFSWSLNFLSRGLRTQTIYGGFRRKKIPFITKKPWSGSGSENTGHKYNRSRSGSIKRS
jgi:hypothetical protein